VSGAGQSKLPFSGDQDPLSPPRVNACGFPGSEAPSTREVPVEHPCGHPSKSAAPVGQPLQRPRVFIEVRQPLLDPRRTPLSRRVRRPSALRELLQTYVFTSTTTDHPNIPCAASCARDDRLVGRRVASSSGRSSKVRRVRGRDFRISTSHDVIARAAGFAPTPDRFGHLLSRTPRTIVPGGIRPFAQCRPTTRRLRDDARLRIVRRRNPAKGTHAHQPEMPSIAGPSSRMVGPSKHGEP
jgi:hypothetical protein